MEFNDPYDPYFCGAITVVTIRHHHLPLFAHPLFTTADPTFQASTAELGTLQGTEESWS